MSDIICITNRRLCEGDFLERIELIAREHPEAIVLREKDLSEDDYRDLAREVMQICQRYGTKCILHSFVNVAIELGCPAIHLPLHLMQRLTSEEKMHFSTIGVSCHSAEDVAEAENLGCTYVTAGHIFDTDCKAGLPGKGLDFLRNICGRANVPVYAIGGVDSGNIGQIRECGTSGGCIMSGFMKCADIHSFMSEYEAVQPYAIFDMDGTLVDSMHMWADLPLRYLESKGFEVDPEVVLAKVEKLTLKESVHLFADEMMPGADKEAILTEIKRLIERMYETEISLKPGVREHLEFLKAKGVKMCVVTATDSTLAKICLERNDIIRYFDFVMSCEDYDMDKNSPQIYYKATDILGGKPCQTAVYEDALHAIRTALDGGFHVIGVKDDSNEKYWNEIVRICHRIMI